MIYSFRKLIAHYASATLIDVLHSPFVFELYNDCIARKKYPAELSGIANVWAGALKNSTIIEQTDFGAIPQTRRNTVSFFAKLQAKPKRLAHILYRMVHKYQYRHCIELGTSLGYSTMHLAKGLPAHASLTTIEGAKDLARVAQVHFEQAGLSEKIRCVTGKFDDVVPEIIQTYPTIDFAFIDGNHTYEATMHYFYQFLAKKNNNSVFVFDDIYWSKGMTQAWEEIKAHPEVMVTVDLFFIGLVFFRQEQRKQHFKLRVW